jgi:hypothetical protein
MRPALTTEAGAAGFCTRTDSQPQLRRFRYHLLDVAGREVDVLDRSEPLQIDETITVNGVEPWRVVAVLGVAATVAHA